MKSSPVYPPVGTVTSRAHQSSNIFPDLSHFI
jgi:hypothetical protein